ncbi:hypothetical protein AB0M22_16975 [Nocardia sp. NPDC051756]|uniref:hypothetical protein n=1 Tax=Nocardia sp. NPDC051756 TaxID=3154751 RepID=UPI003417ABE5
MRMEKITHRTALAVLGLGSTLTILVAGAPAGAVPFGDATPTDPATVSAEAISDQPDWVIDPKVKTADQFKKSHWQKLSGEIVVAACGHAKDFTDSGIAKWWDTFDTSPLEFRQSPTKAAIARVFNPDSKFALPAGSSEADIQRHALDKFCNSSEVRTELLNALRTFSGQYGRKLKPGMDTDYAIVQFEIKKTQMQEALLIEEGFLKKNEDDGL